MEEDIEYVGGHIVVKLISGADSTQVDSLLSAHSLSIRRYFDPNRWGLMECDTSANIFEKISSLLESPLIEAAEPNVVFYPTRMPDDPHFEDSSQWALWNPGKHGTVDADIDAPEAWDIDTGHADLIVAVLDAGFPYVDTGTGPILCHADFSDSSRYFLGYRCSDTCWADLVMDDMAHGSPVTGIIAATTNNDEGVAGVLWSCRVYAMKIFGLGSDSIGLSSGTADAIDSCLSFGSRAGPGTKVINISGMRDGCHLLKLEEAIARANDSGCVIVASETMWPAAYASWGEHEPDGYRNVIAVGGSSGDDKHAVGCSEGAFRITVDAPVYAPTAVYLALRFWEWGQGDCSGYGPFAGSSCAVPHVSGVAGLLWSHAMSQGRSNFSPDSVRWFIEHGADDIEAPGWDDCTGYGRVNAMRALMAMDGYYPNATGYLRANATWGDTLGDTLYVLGDIVIPEACTLTIDSGAVIKFLTNDREDFGVDSTKCEIIVQGKLVVNGAQNDSVWFISDGAAPSDSDWYGITLDSTGTIELNYCNIENALAPIPWDSVGKYDLSHVKIRHCRDGITVGSSMYFELNHCAFEENTNGITVSTGGALRFDSCAVIKYNGNGIHVQIGGSAKLTGCLFELNHTGLYFNNAASDSVIGCTFKDDFMYGINAQNNDNLLIDGCIFVDSTGSDSGYYGILCKSDLRVENSFFQGYRYGIKISSSKGTTASPLIEDCGFYNIGEVGIWPTSGAEPTIKKCCFKGSYDKACIQIDGEDPYISQCYMASENGETLIGMLFTNGATGTVRRTTIWDYDSCAVQIDGDFTNPDFGDSDSGGCNWFEEPGAGGYYFISSSLNTILAKSNYWDVNDGDTSGIRDKIVGNVDIHPILGKCDHCFPYYSEQCSDLSPSDPTFNPCKIVAAGEERNRGEEEKQKGGAPREFALSQNYPNPFNPQTLIKYDLPEPVHVKLTVYNALGQKVRTLVDEKQEDGFKNIIWDGKTDQGEEVASGIYFFKLRTGDFEATRKMILLR